MQEDSSSHAKPVPPSGPANSRGQGVRASLSKRASIRQVFIIRHTFPHTHPLLFMTYPSIASTTYPLILSALFMTYPSIASAYLI